MDGKCLLLSYRKQDGGDIITCGYPSWAVDQLGLQLGHWSNGPFAVITPPAPAAPLIISVIIPSRPVLLLPSSSSSAGDIVEATGCNIHNFTPVFG